MSELCKHGAVIGRHLNEPGADKAYACPIAVCACCGYPWPYFFIGNVGPPLGPDDRCDQCGGWQVKDLDPQPPPPKTLQERLAEFKARKASQS